MPPPSRRGRSGTGDDWVITGAKRFISNAPAAGLYVVFARTGAEPGTSGLSAFVVPRDAPGLTGAAMHTLAPHVIGELRFDRCRVPADHLLGARGRGVADRDGDARRLPRLGGRPGRRAGAGGARPRDRRTLGGVTQFGQPIAQFQAIQAKLADMATELRAARLLVYSAARLKDAGVARVTLESSMAKLFATEMAQRVVDQAVQIHGGAGVLRGSPIERLYREVRAPRIYEGTSEIQRLIIARQLLRDAETAAELAGGEPRARDQRRPAGIGGETKIRSSTRPSGWCRSSSWRTIRTAISRRSGYSTWPRISTLGTRPSPAPARAPPP